MKTANLYLGAVVAVWSFGVDSAHAQSNPDVCQGHLKAAAEANKKVPLDGALEKFLAGGCLAQPSPQQLSKASIEGLMYMLYVQSTKRSADLVPSSAAATPGGWAGAKGDIGGKADAPGGVKPAGPGAAANIPKERALLKKPEGAMKAP